MVQHSVPAERSGDWLRWLLLGLILLVVAGIIIALPLGDYLLYVLTATEALGAWGYLALIVIYVVSAVFLVPGSLLTLAAGFLFGVIAGFILVSVGSTLGAAAGFLISRYFARERVEHRVASHPKFQAIDGAVLRQGFKIVLLARLTPIFPYSLLNYAFGITSMNFRSYIVASWIGMIPATILYVYLGATAQDLTQILTGNIEMDSSTTFKALGLAATAALVFTVTRIARNALKEAAAASEAKERK
jgi:uncharacterized membrane protein YdjX (TVP38/TMEM64 family)